MLPAGPLHRMFGLFACGQIGCKRDSGAPAGEQAAQKAGAPAFCLAPARIAREVDSRMRRGARAVKRPGEAERTKSERPESEGFGWSRARSRNVAGDSGVGCPNPTAAFVRTFLLPARAPETDEALHRDAPRFAARPLPKWASPQPCASRTSPWRITNQGFQEPIRPSRP